MLLRITTTHQPATDLGYLLHKHPGKVQTFDFSVGQAHVFYSDVSESRCTFALLLDIDSIGLVRDRKFASRMDQYVNDRPYVASSFLSVAIARVLGTALNGKCDSHQALADTAIPLKAEVVAVPCRGDETLVRRLFEPLGYKVDTTRHLLDSAFPDWGMSPYHTVSLSGQFRLSELLSHLYVIIPVLDDYKHYWVDEEELKKLLNRGEAWLAKHPEKELIVNRYLKHRRRLAEAALNQLVEEDGADPDEASLVANAKEETLEERVSLHDQRLGAVMAVLRQTSACSVIDLGCGEGKLLRRLLDDRQFERIVGMDVSFGSLQHANERLKLDNLPPLQRSRIQLIHGSLTYRDKRMLGFDAAAVVEVIEHLDPNRLAAFERVVFEFARPGTVVITTPNREYNIRFEALPAGQFRHRDHRFEWTRDEFRNWAAIAANRFGYSARFLPIGTEDSEVGPPSQMGVFTR
jgi:3' terminal RNA ribose 2'-O-methyltransferase Hen1